jgi:transposase InsO family protein
MVRNRDIGWEHLHVAIDDASRLACAGLLPDERKQSAGAFLKRVMSGNESAHRSADFRAAIAAAGLRHVRTRPYTP